MKILLKVVNHDKRKGIVAERKTTRAGVLSPAPF